MVYWQVLGLTAIGFNSIFGWATGVTAKLLKYIKYIWKKLRLCHKLRISNSYAFETFEILDILNYELC